MYIVNDMNSQAQMYSQEHVHLDLLDLSMAVIILTGTAAKFDCELLQSCVG